MELMFSLGVLIVVAVVVVLVSAVRSVANELYSLRMDLREWHRNWCERRWSEIPGNVLKPRSTTGNKPGEWVCTTSLSKPIVKWSEKPLVGNLKMMPKPKPKKKPARKKKAQ